MPPEYHSLVMHPKFEHRREVYIGQTGTNCLITLSSVVLQPKASFGCRKANAAVEPPGFIRPAPRHDCEKAG